MGRRLAGAALLVTAGGAVAPSVSTASEASTSPPVKTTTPPPEATIGPPTTLWPATTTAPTSALEPPQTTTFPSKTTELPSQTTTFPPPTSATFDAVSLFSGFYGQLSVDPFAAADYVDQTALGSAAEAFLYHEVGVSIAIFGNTSAPLPAYTVTADGPAVDVCRDDGVCESFSDFTIDAALLDTFSIDGQPMDPRASTYDRVTTVETVTVDAAFAVRRPRDELLSVVVLLTTEGGGSTFAWEQATYVDATGRQFAIDAPNSQFPTRMEDGGLDVAHVSFVGAQHGGQLVIPMTSDQTGVATTIRIPIILR